MPARPITHAGPLARAAADQLGPHLVARRGARWPGAAAGPCSSSSGTSRSGSPGARRAGLRASGRGPVTSARNAASALSSGPSPCPSGPAVSGASGQSRAGAERAWRSGMAAPRGREFAVFAAPMKPPALDLSWTCDIPSAWPFDVPAMYFSCTRQAGVIFCGASRVPAAPPCAPAAGGHEKYNLPSSCAFSVPGTSQVHQQVHRRYTAGDNGARDLARRLRLRLAAFTSSGAFPATRKKCSRAGFNKAPGNRISYMSASPAAAGRLSPWHTRTAPPRPRRPAPARTPACPASTRTGVPLSVWPAIPAPGPCPASLPPCPARSGGPPPRRAAVITAFTSPGDLVVAPDPGAAVFAAAAAAARRAATARPGPAALLAGSCPDAGQAALAVITACGYARLRARCRPAPARAAADPGLIFAGMPPGSRARRAAGRHHQRRLPPRPRRRRHRARPRGRAGLHPAHHRRPRRHLRRPPPPARRGPGPAAAAAASLAGPHLPVHSDSCSFRPPGGPRHD